MSKGCEDQLDCVYGTPLHYWRNYRPGEPIPKDIKIDC